MTTIEYKQTQYLHSCCNCGVKFSVPTEFDNERRNDGKSFYCPSGHSQAYTESAQSRAEKAAKRAHELLAQERAKAIQREAEMQGEIHRLERLRESANRRTSAARGQVTKIKNRVKNGVCPCCNRHFENLERHMTTKHPDYSKVE